MISVCNIVKSYAIQKRAVSVLANVSLKIGESTFSVVCGPSGCGKSTLLLVIGALLHPDSGLVTIAGENLLAMPDARGGVRRAELIGFVFQRFHLLPYLTVEENIECAAIGLPGAIDKERVSELMHLFQIDHRQQHFPGELSVGEQQRTALARALYNRPKIILADEPTGNLDPDNAEVVLRALHDFCQRGGTVLMATHDPVAAAWADQKFLFSNGRVEQA